MNNEQKKNTVIGLLIAAILFTILRTKKLVPSVEVGNGSFGKFDTDGDFAEYEPKQKESIKAPIGTGFGTPVFNPNSVLKPIYNNSPGSYEDC